tara:strand:- start:29705 stop:34690 length:4986 start_codon:yes stop_codon:yes gene_type:complete
MAKKETNNNSNCPKSTQNLELNKINQNSAVEVNGYGKARGAEKCAGCAFYDTSSRMKDCIDKKTKVGYCWENHFACKASSVCDSYEKGGPIDNDKDSYQIQDERIEDAMREEPFELEPDMATQMSNTPLPEEQFEQPVEQPMMQQPMMQQPQTMQEAIQNPEYYVNQYKHGGRFPFAQDGLETAGEEVANIGADAGEAAAAAHQAYNETPFIEVDFHPTEVPKDIMLRQSMAESSLRDDVVSEAGAAGLTQIMPATLKDYIKATGHKDVDIYDWVDAIKVQNWLMNDLYNADWIDKPDQSDKVRMAKTLAAYNWGRTAFNEFINKKKNDGIDIYSDDMTWLQDLPPETREYLDKILFDTHEGFQSDVDTLLNKQSNQKYLDAYGIPSDYEYTPLQKYGGSLPKAQKGNEAIMIMGDAARANEAGLDTEYSDLRNDQNLTTEQALLSAEIAAGTLPVVGEIVDGWGFLWNAALGRWDNAMAYGASFLVPGVSGAAYKGSKAAYKAATKTPYKVPKWASREVPNYGHYDDVFKVEMKNMKTRGSDLDALIKSGKFNINDIPGENIVFHGTGHAGRAIVEVPMPGGGSQFFYKSTDASSLAMDGYSKGVKDMWQPFGGFADKPYTKSMIAKRNNKLIEKGYDHTHPRWLKEGDTHSWFMKDSGYEDFYGSQGFRDISGTLDKHMMEQGWDMSGQLILQGTKNKPLFTYPYKDADWINKEIDFNQRLYEKMYGGSLPKAQDGIFGRLQDRQNLQILDDHYYGNENKKYFTDTSVIDGLDNFWDRFFTPSYETSLYHYKDYDTDDMNYNALQSTNNINMMMDSYGDPNVYKTKYPTIYDPFMIHQDLFSKGVFGDTDYIPQTIRSTDNDPRNIAINEGKMNMLEYQNMMLNSPGYQRRLRNEVLSNLVNDRSFFKLDDIAKNSVVEQHMQNIMNDRFKSAQNVIWTHRKNEDPGSGGTYYYNWDKNAKQDPVHVIANNPNSGTYTDIHEARHALTYSNAGMTDYAFNTFKDAKWMDPAEFKKLQSEGLIPEDLKYQEAFGTGNYLGNPTEMDARKAQTEDWLIREGIYDSTGTHDSLPNIYTAEIDQQIRKLIEDGKAPYFVETFYGNDTMMDMGPKIGNQWNKKVSEEDMVNIMNTIAFNKEFPQDELEVFHDDAYAQHGGAIRSAQNGEEVDDVFTPSPGMYEEGQNNYLDLNHSNVQLPPENTAICSGINCEEETEETKEDNSDGDSKTFNEAFAEAEAAGLKVFTWNGKEYKVAHPEDGSSPNQDNTESTDETTDETTTDETTTDETSDPEDEIKAEDHNLSSLTPEQKQYLANTYGKVPHPVAGTSTGVSPTAGVGQPGDLMDLIYTVKGIADRFKSENYVKRGRELYKAQQGTGEGIWPFNEEWNPDQPDANVISNDTTNNTDNIMQDAPNQDVSQDQEFPFIDADNDGIPDTVDADGGDGSGVAVVDQQPTIGPQPAPEDNQDNFPFDQVDPNTNPDPNTDPNTDPNAPDPNAPDPNTDPGTDPGIDPNADPGGDPGGNPGGERRWQDSKAIQTGEKIAQGAVDAARFANAWLQRRKDAKRAKQQKKMTMADNLYQTTDADISGQKGDYNVNTGIFREDDKVISRQGKYGTELSKFLYSEGGRTEQLRRRDYHDVDTTLDLDENTIQELMAAGAEIEFL